MSKVAVIVVVGGVMAILLMIPLRRAFGSRDISPILLRQIARDIGLTIQQFLEAR